MTGLNSDLTIRDREKDIKKAINWFMTASRIRKEYIVTGKTVE